MTMPSSERHDFMKMHLAAVCAELHEHHTGTSDGLTDEDYHAAMQRLQQSLKHWKAPTPFCGPYDSAIYAMVNAVISESRIRYAERPVRVDPDGQTCVGKAIGSPPDGLKV